MRNLIDDRGEQLPTHIGRGFKLLVGARTRRAQQIAAVGRFQIEANRILLRDIVIGGYVLEIAGRIDRPVCRRALHPIIPLKNSRSPPAHAWIRSSANARAAARSKSRSRASCRISLAVCAAKRGCWAR